MNTAEPKSDRYTDPEMHIQVVKNTVIANLLLVTFKDWPQFLHLNLLVTSKTEIFFLQAGHFIVFYHITCA